MRLSRQLHLLLALAALAPLGLGVGLLGAAEAEVARRTRGEQEALARAAAAEAGRHLLGAPSSPVRSAGGGALREPGPAVPPGALTRLSAPAPHPGEEGQGEAGGGLQGARASAVAPAVARAGGPGTPPAAAPRPPGPLGAALAQVAGGEGRHVDLVDGEGRVLASADPSRVDRVLPPDVLGGAGEGAGHREDAGARLASTAAVPGQPGLRAVVTADAASALAPVHALRRPVLLALGLYAGVLLAAGGLLTRRLRRRLARLAQAAEALRRGERPTGLRLEGADELAAVARTLDRLGEELAVARARLHGVDGGPEALVEGPPAELQAARGRLLEAHTLAAVRQLGAGVAHEINNPLAGILGHVQLLMLDRAAGDRDLATLQHIELAARRVRDITRALLRFGQDGERQARQPLELNAVVTGALALAEGAAQGEGVQLARDLAPGPLPLHGDAGQLAEVLLALVQNACTAVAGAPVRRVTVSTREEAGEVVLAVRDTGRGIRAEHLPRIFEPFFSTKDVWSNVGLGLSVSLRAVQLHGGRITVDTVPGEGSTFTVRLPRA
jgi:signal transduction histidine kinase